MLKPLDIRHMANYNCPHTNKICAFTHNRHQVYGGDALGVGLIGSVKGRQ